MALKWNKAPSQKKTENDQLYKFAYLKINSKTKKT